MKILPLLAAAGVLGLLPPSARTAGDGEGPAAHPDFDDGGALSWSTRLEDARREAKRAGKLIFVEYGREA